MTDLEKALADPNLTREKLFLLCAAAIREAWNGAEVTFASSDTLRIVSADGEEKTAFLENLWRMCRDVPGDERLTIFQRHIRVLLEPFDGASARSTTKENIVPIIKDSEYLAVLSNTAKILKEHLAGDLWIIYALDLPESITTLSPSECDRLGVGQSELRAVSISNLSRILPEIERHGGGPWYLLTAGADYVASILLLDRVWQEFEKEIDGDIVATVPSRDVLLFTTSKSKEGLARIRQKAREIREGGDHVISETLLRRTLGQWKVFE
jgi:uncharacterized protein YtpQ (UPF0354 family)